MVGDWDGDGSQTVGVVRPSAARDSNQLLLRNSNGSVVNFWYGRKGDRLVMPGLGRQRHLDPGILRNGTHWHLKNSLTAGPSKVSLRKQTPGRPGVGNWDNRP